MNLFCIPNKYNEYRYVIYIYRKKGFFCSYVVRIISRSLEKKIKWRKGKSVDITTNLCEEKIRPRIKWWSGFVIMTSIRAINSREIFDEPNRPECFKNDQRQPNDFFKIFHRWVYSVGWPLGSWSLEVHNSLQTYTKRQDYMR